MINFLCKFYFSLIFVLIIFANGFSQNCFEEANAEIRLMLTIEATNTKDITLVEAYKYISKVQIEVDTLESIGFMGYLFLKVSIIERPEEWNESVPILGNNCDGYVVALRKNGGLIHRINGFRHNDLSFLFLDGNKKRIPKRKFLKTHKIKDLDLKCLYNSWRANSLDTSKYPCLQSCWELAIVR